MGLIVLVLTGTACRWGYAQFECGSDGDCADGDTCTEDLCNQGFCDNRPISGCQGCVDWQDCDDGLYCTGTESCQAGTCLSSGDPCVPEICLEQEDRCLSPAAPEFAFEAPTGNRDQVEAGQDFVIQFTVSDPDDDAVVQLYLSEDRTSGCTDGTAVGEPVFEDSGVRSQNLATSGLGTGVYHLCAQVTGGAETIEVWSDLILVWIDGICTWSGFADTTAWTDPNNWLGCPDPVLPPQADDRVIIPGGLPWQPELSSNAGIAGFGLGRGGGTLTVASGAGLTLADGTDAVRSSLTLRGADPTCDDCVLSVAAGNLQIVDDARLTLGSGIRVVLAGATSLDVGTGASGGHLITDPADADRENWPVIDCAVWCLGLRIGGPSGQPSSVAIDGLRTVRMRTWGAKAFAFANHWRLERFDNIDSHYGVLDHDGELQVQHIDFTDCQNGLVEDTAWENLILNDLFIRPDENNIQKNITSHANCAGIGPITITGSGLSFGEVQYGGTFEVVWPDGNFRSCTWNGGQSASWSDPANWDDCSGRAGIPDHMDEAVVPGSTPFAPTLDGGATKTYLFRFNGGPGGGTITIPAGKTFELLASNAFRSSIGFAGSPADCSTCFLIKRVADVVVNNGAMLTVHAGITCHMGDNPNDFLTIGDGLTPGHLKILGGAAPAEWPVLTDDQTGWFGGIQVQGTAGQLSSIEIDGLRILNGGEAEGYEIHLMDYWRVIRLDNLLIDINGTAPQRASILVNCRADSLNETVLEGSPATWNNLTWTDNWGAGGFNIDVSDPECTPANGYDLHINGDTGSPPWGAASANDPNGILTWNP